MSPSPLRAPSAAAFPPRVAVGVDVERADREVALRIATRVLASEERHSLGSGAGLAPAADLLLRVSLKEALYKALHPLLRTSIRWHSVQVRPERDGACEVQLSDLERQTGTHLHAAASWRVRDGYFVTTASAALLAVRGVDGAAAAELAV